MAESMTSFADALAVPQLARACCLAAVRPDSGVHFSGLKVLRQVSKLIDTAMLAHIRSYSLLCGSPKWIGNQKPDPPQAFTLLQQANLSAVYVRVAVSRGDLTELCQPLPGKVDEGLLQLQRRIESFVTRAGRALSSVHYLHLKTYLDASGESPALHEPLDSVQSLRASQFSNQMSRLAPACPALRQLDLYGLSHDRNVRAFGAACPRLTHLSLAPSSLQVQTLDQLASHLPNVWSLAFHGITSCSQQMHQTYIRSAVRSFSGTAVKTPFTHLDLGPDGVMEQAMWAKLPPSLKVLLSYNNSDGQGPAAGVSMPGLLHIRCNYSIKELRDLLLAAPNLQLLECVVNAHCQEDIVPSWNAISARQIAGLYGMTEVNLYGPNEEEILQFLEKVQPLPNATHVLIKSQTHSSHELDADLKDVDRVFPCLENLTFQRMGISDESLQGLLPCHHLEIVTMRDCQHVSEEGVTMMATQFPSLRSLVFNSCRNINGAVGVRLNRVFKKQHLQATISVV